MPEFLDMLSVDRLSALVAAWLRFVFILIMAYMATRIVVRVISGIRGPILDAMKRGAGGSPEELEKRTATISGMIRKTAILSIWVIALIMALKELGFDIGPILAGAGILGLAVGFGAQNLVRDVITGLFMLVENQIRVNDVAVINGTGGLVEEINLRTTVLRSFDGAVHVFPNGNINTLANMTRGFSFYVFDIGVAYKEDTDRVTEVIQEVGAGLMKEEPWAAEILDPVEVLGVDKFADSAVVIKARIKTQPIKQWMVGREFNRRLKRRFDELGIEIPFPHRSIYFGEASRAVQLRLDGSDREELKGAIREVLSETGMAPASSRPSSPDAGAAR